MPYPYLSFKRLSSPVNGHQFQWQESSARELSKAIEISGLLIEYLRNKYHSNLLKKIYPKLDEEVRQARLPSFGKLRLKLSFELLRELDADPSSYSYVTEALVYFKHLVKFYNIDSININFREVFLVPQGESPPLHYRASSDMVVHTLKEYKKQINTFSYLFAKAMFMAFRAQPENIAAYLPKNLPADSMPYDAHRPLNQYPIFDSARLAAIMLKDAQSEVKKQKSLVVALGPWVSIPELEIILINNRQVSEIIFLLYGNQYRDMRTRQGVYRELLALIKRCKCQSFLHLFLLTEETIPHTLQALAPKQSDGFGAFTPLPYHAGFYLSCPKLFLHTYRHKQASNVPYWLKSLPVEQPPAEEKNISAYIYGKKESADFRKSKRQTKAALKAKASLSINHQLAVSQNEEISEAKELSQSLTQNQQVTASVRHSHNQNQKHGSIFDKKLYFDDFCAALAIYARKKLKDQDPLEYQYLSQYAFKQHDKAKFLDRLAHDEAFRRQVTAKVFGVLLLEDETWLSLPNYSIDSIEAGLADMLLWHIYSLEGPDTSVDTIELHYPLFGGRTWTALGQNLALESHDTQNHISVSSLSLISHAYQSHLQYSALIRDEDLANLAEPEKRALIAEALSLLHVVARSVATKQSSDFKSHWIASPTARNDAFQSRTIQRNNPPVPEAAFFALMRFHFPENPEYLQTLEHFFAIFEEHTADNLKILTQIMISGYRPRMEAFLKFLTVLEARGLLAHFYKIYFKYAQDVFSVAELLRELEIIEPTKTQLGPAFPQLACNAKIPSIQNWPLFEKFSLAILIFHAKHYPELYEPCISELKDLWNDISLKLLIYTNQQPEEAQILLESFVRHILEGEDLSLLPVGTRSSLFPGLLKLLDHAMEQQTLEEQLRNLSGVSLLRSDALYAMEQNDFQIVCAEMHLEKAAIDQKTKRYSVSLEELMLALADLELGKGTLRRTVFRYLGQVRFREDLQFYRELFIWKKSCLDDLLIAYFVATTTGIEANSEPSQEQFSQDFFAYLVTHPWGSTLAKEEVRQRISEFFIELGHKKTPETQGLTSLWSFWQEASLPVLLPHHALLNVCSKKFPSQASKRFLLANQKALQTAALDLSQEEMLALSLIKTWLPDKSQATALILLKILYEDLTFSVFLKNLNKIIAFVESYALLIKRGASRKIYAPLKDITQQTGNIDVALAVINLISPEMAEQHSEEASAHFLTAFGQEPSLLLAIGSTKPLLAAILKYYLKTPEASLPQLFALVQTLAPLGIERANPILKQLLTHMARPKTYQFFHKYQDLSKEQLEIISQLLEPLQDGSLLLPFLEQSLAENPKTDFAELAAGLKTAHPKQCLKLAQILGNVESLARLKHFSLGTLEELLHLNELYKLSQEELQNLINSPSLKEATTAFERAKHAHYQYRYDLLEVAQKIAAVRYKSRDGELIALSPKTQEKLLSDYAKVMSYMSRTPILIDQGRAFTLHELNQDQCQLLFKTLMTRIRDTDKPHELQLMIIALSAEVMLRTTNKFPRHTQIINILNGLHQNRDLIHEVKTGEGKSILAAMHALLLYDGKTSIDIVTENDELAKEGLNTFKYLFRYLGVPCNAEIIEAHSPHKAYVENGINYTTPSNLALFRARMLLLRKKLPAKVALICDEIDAFLTTLVQFRLSAIIDPKLLDPAWADIYKALLAFVKEKELFIDNTCSETEDVLNFKRFFALQNPGNKRVDFVKKLSVDTLSPLIESVQIAKALEGDQDYFVVEKPIPANTYYAAPILDSNHRPEPKVSYSAGVQPILHTALNQEEPGYRYEFPIDPVSDTIIVISAKNFFDFYRKNGGRTIGLTGTGGFEVELQEFWENQGLVVFVYPPFHEKPANNLGIIAARGPVAHRQALHETILKRKRHPTQPVLIITGSPKDSFVFKNYLAEQGEAKLQIYHGYETEGQSEKEVITQAALDNSISIANQSLSRGADFSTKHPNGFFVINTSSQVTKSDTTQIEGREGRNGEEGQFCSVLDSSTFAPENSTHEEINTAFREHQRNLSIQQQRQRLKLRLLEKARHRIVNEYIFPLREAADQILNRQYGLAGEELVSNEDLMRVLSKFNTNAEQHYNELLSNHTELESQQIEVFLEARVREYQQILESWLPDTRFLDFSPIEPLVPLENLQNLQALDPMKMEDLILISELWSKTWQLFGHQKMQLYFAKIDQQIAYFTLYFNRECSLQVAIGKSLEGQGLMTRARYALFRTRMESEELLEFASQIKIVGALIPKDSIRRVWIDYLKETEQKIKEKRWDALCLPQVDFEAINLWFGRINTALTVSSVIFGGPIPFIVNRYIIPTLIHWLCKKFANSNSRYLQAIAGLNNIGSDLCNLITGLVESARKDELTVGVFIDKLAPLLNNKCLHEAIIALLKLNKQTAWIPFVQAAPELLSWLEPYRDQKCNKLLTPEMIALYFAKICQLEAVKKALEDTNFEDTIARCHFSPQWVALFQPLTFIQALGFIKVIAHPEFFNAIKSLPPKANFSELRLCLEAKPETLPIEMQAPLARLQAYQSEATKIAGEQKRRLRGLKQQFSLSVEQLKTDLQEKLPELPNLKDPEIVSQEKPIPWLRVGAATLGFTMLILYNIFFFTLTALLISLILVALFAYPFVKNTLIPRFMVKNTPASKEEPLKPILIASNTAAYQHNGFFAAAHEERSLRQNQQALGLA